MKRALARREDVGVLVVEREEGASILQREAGAGGTSPLPNPCRCFERDTMLPSRSIAER